MADEKSSNTQRSGGQGGRRHYFRRRVPANRSGSNQSNPPSKDPPSFKPNGQDKAPSPGRNGRLGRRRRRTRNRAAEVTAKTAPIPAESIANLDDYAPPAAVFIYTYVSRPGSRDSYEFRSEHFSKVGRRLEDYTVDLSILYTDNDDHPTAAPRSPAAPYDPADLDAEWESDEE